MPNTTVIVSLFDQVELRSLVVEAADFGEEFQLKKYQEKLQSACDLPDAES